MLPKLSRPRWMARFGQPKNIPAAPGLLRPMQEEMLVFSSGYPVFSVALWESLLEHAKHLKFGLLKIRSGLPRYIALQDLVKVASPPKTRFSLGNDRPLFAVVFAHRKKPKSRKTRGPTSWGGGRIRKKDLRICKILAREGLPNPLLAGITFLALPLAVHSQKPHEGGEDVCASG